LTLPAFSLAFAYIAWVARVTQTAVRGELHAEHVDTARSRGLPERWIVRRHVVRNASPPILAVSGLMIAGLFAGTAVAEEAFGINGLGSLLVESASKQDLAVVQILSLLMVAAFVVINSVVDIANAALDPRQAVRDRA
jgi:peptide/nickel transport system permease protein